jgi:hypothetical protein
MTTNIPTEVSADTIATNGTTTSADPNADFRELCFETISRINAAHAAVLHADATGAERKR